MRQISEFLCQGALPICKWKPDHTDELIGASALDRNAENNGKSRHYYRGWYVETPFRPFLIENLYN